MKKISLTIAAVAAALTLAPAAHADSWIDDESAGICNSLSLVSAGYSDWASIQISLLQSQYDVSRSTAVAAMRTAAVNYCPEYVSAVPVR